MKKILFAFVVNLSVSSFAMAESSFFDYQNQEIVQDKCTLKKPATAAERFYNGCIETMKTGTFQVSAVDTCLQLGSGFWHDWDAQRLYCLHTIRDKVYSEEYVAHCKSKKAGEYPWQNEADRVMQCLEKSDKE